MTGSRSLQTRVTETSRWSYKDVESSGVNQDQVSAVEELLRIAGEKGLTDFELRELMSKRGWFLPLGSISARRNDVNRRHNYGVVVHKGYRVNPATNKPGRVWVYSIEGGIL